MAEIYNSINPNKIRRDTTTTGLPNTFNYDSLYLNVNTWYFGIDVNRPYAPSSGTGWYQGIDARTIDDAVNTIYYTGSTKGKTLNANDFYRCVQYTDQQDVINFVNGQGGSVASIEDALYWFKDDGSGKGGNAVNVCVNMNYPNIPTSGLTFGVDSGFVASYPWINPTWYDFRLSTMSGFSGNSAVLGQFDGTNLFFNFDNKGLEYFTSPRVTSLGQNFTVIFWGAPTVVADTNTHAAFSVDSSSLPQYVGIYDNKTNVDFYFKVYDTTNTVRSRIGATNYTSGIWGQFSYVFQTNSGGTTTTSFYYNDVLSETNVESYLVKSWNFAGTNDGWNIGQIARTQTLANNYIGGMAVVLVYDRVLKAEEIADIYLNYRDSRLLFQ
jgi:hypothetical protein